MKSNAELVEPARDEQLVLQREVDALALAAVAQRRVVDVDSRHVGLLLSACAADFLWPGNAKTLRFGLRVGIG